MGVFTGSYAAWEKKQHGKCGPGHHVPYRVTTFRGRETRCKLCYHTSVDAEMAESGPCTVQSRAI